MIERAAAARNAGIDGYQPDSETVKKAASAASSSAATDFDVVAYDGLHNPSIAERMDANEPITDIWTFGAEPSTSSLARGSSTNNETIQMSPFEKLKNALPKLALDKFRMK